jgi:S1-C subfamily serine protease
LIDPAGNLVGLNSSTLGRGSGLTIPTPAIDSIVAALQAHGKVRRGFLGIGAQAVTIPAALASAAGVSQESGLVVVSVEPDGPAERGGLILGDVIVTIAGEPVKTVEDLQDRLSGDWVGRPIPIQILRGGTSQELSVTVGERG